MDLLSSKVGGDETSLFSSLNVYKKSNSVEQ